MKQSKDIILLLKLIDEAYEKRAWQGTNLRGALRGITAQEAAWRPESDRHNMWEIMVHAAYWKYIVRRRLLGEKKGSFPLKGSNWIKRPIVMSENAWHEDIRLLDEMHRSMCVAITQIKLSEIKRGDLTIYLPEHSIVIGRSKHMQW